MRRPLKLELDRRFPDAKIFCRLNIAVRAMLQSAPAHRLKPKMNTTTIALINIGIAILIGGLSIPLIRRKVPMNHFYGVRFPQSFKSEKAWYEINEYGGRLLLLWSVPILLIGIYGLLRPDLPTYFSLISSGVLIFSVMIACLQSYLKARQIHNNNA
jgi:uncharacterized membrane protein